MIIAGAPTNEQKDFPTEAVKHMQQKPIVSLNILAVLSEEKNGHIFGRFLVQLKTSATHH